MRVKSVAKTLGISTATLIMASIIGAVAQGDNKSNFDVQKTETKNMSQIEQSQNKETSRTVTVEEEINFQSVIQSDPQLTAGTTEVRVVGVNGIRNKTFKVSYVDGIETKRELINDTVVKEPINEIIANGTMAVYVAPSYLSDVTESTSDSGSNCDLNYKPCIPYVSGNVFNCDDIGVNVQVTGDDHHKFDRDGDGWGCESN